MISIGALLLNFSILRKSVVTQIKSKYFNELDLSIPLSSGYWAHLLENDSYNSFSEIFLQKEYEHFLPDIKFSKILDLGAHYGYFSLWLQTKLGTDNLHSLLIEPSTLCRISLKNLISQPKLSDRFKYLTGAIGNPKNQTLQFFDRPFMAGSKFTQNECTSPKKIKILTQEEIIETLDPPYDLIKCDIEGSEWDFLEHYKDILLQSNYLLMEWHSWHSGGGGFEQIKQCIGNLGFEILNSSNPHSSEGVNGEVGLFLAINKNFKS